MHSTYWRNWTPRMRSIDCIMVLQLLLVRPKQWKSMTDGDVQLLLFSLWFPHLQYYVDRNAGIMYLFKPSAGEKVHIRPHQICISLYIAVHRLS